MTLQIIVGLVSAIFGGIISLVGSRWLDIWRRKKDESLGVMTSRVAEAHPQYEHDIELNFLIDNASPVSVVAKSIAFSSPAGSQPMHYYELISERLVVNELPLNIPIPPYSVVQTSVPAKASEKTIKEVHENGFAGTIVYSIRGKETSLHFEITRDEVQAHYQD